MNTIEVYQKWYDYEKLQYMRPDYVRAISSSIDLANKYMKNVSQIVVSDFCCGTGSNTKKLAEKVHGIKKAILIDINARFLELATLSDFDIKEIEIINNDILQTNMIEESDLVLSIFAYHHITNDDKIKYIKKIKEALKKNAILIITEIYLPDKESWKKYYDKLINEIEKNKLIPELEQFLRQTAESEDFEFKVAKKFADNQLEESGFTKLKEVKIRPLDNSFDDDIGTFVQVYTY